MKRHNVILESNVEPKDNNVLWLQGNKLKKFGNTGWEDIIEGDVVTTDRIENGAVTTDKIAADAFDSTLSKSEKIAPANIVGNKITTLDEKVDALALGKFYGYFPDSTSFPADVSIPGYAYVRLDNSYKIWNFNGESWYDSGVSINENDVIITTDRIQDGAVTSEKIATSAFDDTLSVSGKIAPADVVGRKLSELDSKTNKIKNSVQDLDGDTFYITDSQGNIVAKIDADGVKAIEVIAQGKKLSEMPDASDMKIKSILDDFYKEEFYITDGQGNVAFKVTKDGIEYINRIVYETSQFRGKEFFTIGDSFCAGGQWQKAFASINGSIHNQTENNGTYSFGGTQTLDLSGNCGMDRISRLLQNHPEAEFIFIQNVNDANRGPGATGNETDTPYMMKHNVVYQNIQQDMETAKNAISSAILSTERRVGTMVRVPYRVNGKKVRILSRSEKGGLVTVTINGTQFGVTINAGSSAYEISKQIEAWDYSSIGINAKAVVDEGGTRVYGVVFSDATGEGRSVSVSLNVGSTGITYEIVDAETVSYVGKCFTSYNVNDWNNDSYWKLPTEISLWSLYKGIIEYAMTNFPNAYIAFVGFPHFNFTQNSPKRADGSFEWDSVCEVNKWLQLIQKSACERMRIPFYDVLTEAGMNVYNYFTYYNSGDVHPKQEGYERWGKVLAKLVE